ncbi:PPOX class F420-dependent oxidoreductase [Streptomyces platensis]|uniref:PPOX class F420-dependent oxidoreductase n=1 Tax=Streptomyces platensis TaxID=58346 RepID=A0AAE6TQK4_STRPT|nr:PPOX class F420-dependent oxidoreductase [Streptomyces platensis]OSY48340.1 Pyridoxamine 5'-phosphate oxidase [Streptomyces platensis]QEV56029.1 PPOX class F420-dependent oxidoreductase [Streptomyces platensis]
MPFTPKEISYMRSQGYGRLATVGPNGEPHNVPVSFQFDDGNGVIEITGRNMGRSQKYRNVLANDRVAFVVDDIPCRDPEVVRAVVVHGRARALTAGGKARRPHCDEEMIAIRPLRIISWGIEGDLSTGAHSRRIASEETVKAEKTEKAEEGARR